MEWGQKRRGSHGTGIEKGRKSWNGDRKEEEFEVMKQGHKGGERTMRPLLQQFKPPD